MAKKAKKTKIKKKMLVKSLYLLAFIAFLVAIYFCSRYFFQCFPLGRNAGADQSKETKIAKEVRMTEQNLLVFSSFFDSFASDHLIDFEKTDLHRDHLAAAVMFPPEYTLEEAEVSDIRSSREELTNLSFVPFPASSSEYLLSSSFEKRCLAKGCLEQRSGKLFFAGKELTLPSEISRRELLAVTLGALENRFLVGFTIKNETGDEERKYEGLVYSFDGKRFSKIVREGEIVSRYFGLLGFGGEEDDFLVIYGAYLGKAFRFQGNRVTDISSFFDYRFMTKGFRPEVVTVKKNRVHQWYIFSLSSNKPRFIKLWPDKNDNIAGEIDYPEVFNGGDQEAAIKLLSVSDEKVRLLIFSRGNGVENWRVFSDLGFTNQTEGELVFKPIINDFTEPEIVVEKLANSSLGNKWLPCREAILSFSPDSANWQPVPQGYYLNKDFNSLHISKYFLRVNFPAQKDKFYSPFLSEVLFDFYYRKMI